MQNGWARAGVCSRRDAEKLIEEGRVSVNGKKLTTPAFKVTADDTIRVDGKYVEEAERTRLWRYHKPAGLMTTHKDPAGRPTVFENLPKDLPRVISIGRLDFNSEGLLLLTNDGALARRLELPITGWIRRYRVRAHGITDQETLDTLAKGVTVDGVKYGAINVQYERKQASNVWLAVSLTEGKNREVRRVLESIGLKVNRLIRISYGPFQLGALEPARRKKFRASCWPNSSAMRRPARNPKRQKRKARSARRPPRTAARHVGGASEWPSSQIIATPAITITATPA